MLNKAQVINAINTMPDRFSFDDLLEKIMLLQKIELGLEQSNSGKVVSTDEAKERFKKSV
jgi:hypothetical protein